MSARGFAFLALALVVASCGHPAPQAAQKGASNAASAATSPDAALAQDIASAPLDSGAPVDSGAPAADASGGDAAAGGDTYYGQPVEERTAQQALPQSHDVLWRTLVTTQIHEDDARGIYTATHSSAVRALVGQTLTISGFIMPLETTPRFRHFILTRYTPVCDFCPPGAPNEVVEVWSAQPISQTYDMMHVTGRFGLTDNGEKGLFFTLNNATVGAGPHS